MPVGFTGNPTKVQNPTAIPGGTLRHAVSHLIRTFSGEKNNKKHIPDLLYNPYLPNGFSQRERPIAGSSGRAPRSPAWRLLVSMDVLCSKALFQKPDLYVQF